MPLHVLHIAAAALCGAFLSAGAPAEASRVFRRLSGMSHAAIKAKHKAIVPQHTPDYLGAFCWSTYRRRNMQGMIPAACRAVAAASILTRRRAYDEILMPLG